MNVLQITRFLSEIDSLSHPRHLSFMQRANERFHTYLTEAFANALPANLAAAVQLHDTCLSTEDNAYKKNLGSDLTGQLEKADTSRDETLSGIRLMSEALLRIGTPEQKAYAQQVLKKMELYKLSSSDNYEDEGIKVQQLCQDFTTDPALVAAAAACNLTDQFTLLNEQNEECRRLVNARNVERSGTDNQAMNKARKALDAAFADLAMLLNAYNVITFNGTTGTYDQCISVMNADIAYYKQWVLRIGSGSNSGSNGGQPNGGEGGGTVTPDPGTGGGETPDPGTGGGETPDPGTGGGDTPVTPDPGTGGGGGGADPDDPTNSED